MRRSLGASMLTVVLPLSFLTAGPAEGTGAVVTAISVGQSHGCAVLSDGSVKCWGSGAAVGSGDLLTHATPVTVSGITGATAISAGREQSCAVLSNGGVKCWGANNNGELGNGTVDNYSLVPVAVTGISTATAISSGDYHTCALVSGGGARCWGGYNDSGELGHDNFFLDPEDPEETFNGHSHPTPVTIEGITGATAISAGGEHACALLTGGSVRCWGHHLGLGDGSGNASFTPVTAAGITATAIGAGSGHSCAVLTDANVRCWGRNHLGQLGNGTTVESLMPVSVSGLTGAIGISAGNALTCAVLSGGSAECWGMNFSGQLGNGTTTHSSVPAPVSGLANVTGISAGSGQAVQSVCALLADGSASCWGRNNAGQLGNGTVTNSATPVAVVGLSTASDSDGDGVEDSTDAFPLDPSESADTDGDGVGDNADVFPLNAGESVDTDGDGTGDNGDAFPNDPLETTDTDGDGVGDGADNCPALANPALTDSDGDGQGDACDNLTYLFTGFFSPVDNPPVVNAANAGRTIPLKFRLVGLGGPPVSDPASFLRVTSAKVTCGTLHTPSADAVETYSGSSGLQYSGDGTWQFNWATPKTYASSCRVLTLELADGSRHAAHFTFKK